MAQANDTDRDDFTRATKDVIAKRVGYHCSCCGRGTVGPNDDPTRANNLGVAAHITAASRGGPRYDATLTSEERSHARNGIWCCQNCAKEIDNDPRRYPVAVLLELRARAEQAADDRLHVVSTQGTAVTNSEATVRLAAGVILRGWRDVLGFDQSRLVELDLQEYRRDAETTGLPAWTLAQLVEGLKESRIFLLRGEPGAGKTITLLQLAGLMVADATAPIPLVFSVSGWVSSGRDLVSYATEQLSNQGLTVADVRLLLRAGRLAFLLNGWNEAGDEERARAEIQLRELMRNHPGTPLLLSTRVTHATPSFAGETSIDVRRLTQNKKAAIVRASGVTEAERLITRIEGSATLAKITDTPLFLAATIRLAGAGGDIPTTRSRLLLRCVDELENADEHRAMLQAAPCHGYHRKYLAELAAAMTRRGRTTLSAAEAEDAIAACTRRLRETGHLDQSGSAQAILAALVRLHLLVLPPGGRS